MVLEYGARDRREAMRRLAELRRRLAAAEDPLADIRAAMKRAAAARRCLPAAARPVPQCRGPGSAEAGQPAWPRLSVHLIDGAAGGGCAPRPSGLRPIRARAAHS
jgi:hypothetical protein